MLSSARINIRTVGKRFNSSYKTIKSDAELKKYVDAPGNKVLYFTATWCPPCRLIAPVFEKLSKEFTAINFLKIDIDENSDSAAEYGIRSVPTFMFLKNQEVVGQFAGANDALLRTNLTNLNKTA